MLVYDHTVVVDINGWGMIDHCPGMRSTGNGRSTCSVCTLQTAGTIKKDLNPHLPTLILHWGSLLQGSSNVIKWEPPPVNSFHELKVFFYGKHMWSWSKDLADIIIIKEQVTWALKPLRIFMTKPHTADKPMRGGRLLLIGHMTAYQAYQNDHDIVNLMQVSQACYRGWSL